MQNKDVIREEGVIKDLIDIYRGGSQEAQTQAARALCVLAQNMQNKGRVYHRYVRLNNTACTENAVIAAMAKGMAWL